MKKVLKIGLDIHGVIDKYPDLFAKISKNLVKSGNEVHIITGQERSKTESQVHKLGITFTHFHSIIDWHRKYHTHMWTRSDKEGWWMERQTWLSTKGTIASLRKLDIHFDDQIEYAEFFPVSCTFVWVRDNFDEVYDKVFGLIS